MAPENVSGPALEEHYQRQYRIGLESEAEWLHRTATDKVDSIHYLLKNSSIIPHSILEVGCGPGAVLRECQRREIGQKHVGLDYSEEALDYLRRNSEGIDTIRADIRSPDFAVEEPFDLVVLSHVLEHLQDPGVCLQSIVRRVDFSYLILEVPLEDLFLNNLISWFRGRELFLF